MGIKNAENKWVDVVVQEKSRGRFEFDVYRTSKGFKFSIFKVELKADLKENLKNNRTCTAATLTLVDWKNHSLNKNLRWT